MGLRMGIAVLLLMSGCYPVVAPSTNLPYDPVWHRQEIAEKRAMLEAYGLEMRCGTGMRPDTVMYWPPRGCPHAGSVWP